MFGEIREFPKNLKQVHLRPIPSVVRLKTLDFGDGRGHNVFKLPLTLSSKLTTFVSGVVTDKKRRASVRVATLTGFPQVFYRELPSDVVKCGPKVAGNIADNQRPG